MLTIYLLLWIIFPCQCQTSTHSVLQSTLFVSALPRDNVILNCSIAEAKSMSSYTMMWYRQTHKGKPIEFIIKEFDEPIQNFKVILNAKGNMFSLVVSNLSIEDSATYYCAARHSENQCDQYDPAYFGGGTKLTVLEPGKNITKPEVKIIEPSKKELCKKAVTLVCVAEKFYPDHVTIKWKIGNEDFTKGVATDPYAKKNNKTGMFEMSSRFKIKSNVYHNEAKRFQCIVSFYDGEGYINKTATVKGIAGNGFNKEDHMTRTGTVKLAYGMFIAKSGLYGIFIFFFVRRQVSAGK
ncbi:immunoglobulin lambda-1 light chain-like [Paramisgurnus dabryanus]|uniref:immunoglobulin lambda-1 light chain-like n=1 Tax=Paramisgurnus dabryanus TaxID=90735 RepID=UPI0031F3AF68